MMVDLPNFTTKMLVVMLLTMLMMNVSKASCPETVDTTLRPRMRSYSVNTGMDSRLYNIWVSSQEDAIFTLTHIETAPKGFQIAKRGFDLSTHYQESYNFETDLKGATLHPDESNLFTVTLYDWYAMVAKFDTADGSLTQWDEYISMHQMNSIAATDSHVIVGGKIENEVTYPGIVILNISDLSKVAEFAFSGTDFVSVHQMTRDTSRFGISVFEENPQRRNLFTANGDNIGLGVLSPTADLSQQFSLKSFACTSGCATSTLSNIIDLSTGDYLSAVSVKSGNLFFASFDSSFSQKAIYQFTYSGNPNYALKMVESEDRNIYIAMSQNEPLQTSVGSSNFLVLDTQTLQAQEFWTSTLDTALTMDTKYGTVFIGTWSSNSDYANLIKAPLTGLDMLSETVTFSEPRTFAFAEDSSGDYWIEDVSVTGINDGMIGNSVEPDELTNMNGYSEVTNSPETWNSMFYFLESSYQELEVISSNDLTHTYTTFCHVEGSAEMSFALSSLSSDISFISSSPYSFTVTAPNVTSETTYNFKVQVTESWESTYYFKYFKLTVQPCQVENCSKCSSSDAYTCSSCNSDYTLSSDKKSCDEEKLYETKPVAQAMGETVVAVTTTSTATAVAATTISAGSSSAAWVMVNQYQLLLTTPVLETGMPDELLSFMDEFQFFTFNFNFLSFWTFGSIEGVIDGFDYEQPAVGLEIIGYESGSIIVNEYNFGKVIFMILCLDVALIALFFVFWKYRNTPLMKKVSNGLWKFFMFTLIIRLVLEAFYYILICALSEVFENGSDVKEPLSYAVALIVILMCLAIPVFLLVHYLKNRNIEKFTEKGNFTELYDGFKEGYLCQLYYFYFCIRRILSAFIVVFLRTSPLWVRLSLFNLVQLAGLLYAVIIRPFEDHRDNIMEIMNEFLFLAFCILISILHSEDQWNSGLANAILIMIMLNGLLIALVLIISYIKDFVVYISNWNKAKKEKKNNRSKVSDSIQVENKSNDSQVKQSKAGDSHSDVELYSDRKKKARNCSAIQEDEKEYEAEEERRTRKGSEDVFVDRHGDEENGIVSSKALRLSSKDVAQNEFKSTFAPKNKLIQQQSTKGPDDLENPSSARVKPKVSKLKLKKKDMSESASVSVSEMSRKDSEQSESISESQNDKGTGENFVKMIYHHSKPKPDPSSVSVSDEDEAAESNSD